MNKLKLLCIRIGLILLIPFSFNSCITEDVESDTPMGNFESLWHTLDEHYCFFDYKAKESGLNWDSVHAKYVKRITTRMSDDQLFEVCDSMIRELRDGHVNVTASHDVARYWEWYENYPANFSDSLQRVYLGTNYHITAGLKYKTLSENVGYVYCGSFDSGFGSGNLSEIVRAMAICSGIIIDVRNNSGGMLSAAVDLAGLFTNEKIVGGYMAHKTGTGHNDISAPEPIYIDPCNGLRWQKRVVILTNRHCYSAANSFVMFMKAIPTAVIVGDNTGGGAGLPFQSEMPNGWSVRFSACPMYDKNMNSTEAGIVPDVKVNITSDDMQRNVDTILEAAIALIQK